MKPSNIYHLHTSKNIAPTDTITYITSGNFSSQNREHIKNISRAFFLKNATQEEKNYPRIHEDIEDYLEHYLIDNLSIKLTNNNTIKISSPLNELFMDNPLLCVAYMNLIITDVQFVYNNGIIEIIPGGPGKPTPNTVINHSRQAANDALFRKAA